MRFLSGNRSSCHIILSARAKVENFFVELEDGRSAQFHAEHICHPHFMMRTVIPTGHRNQCKSARFEQSQETLPLVFYDIESDCSS